MRGYFHDRGPLRIRTTRLVVPKVVENRYTLALRRIVQAVHRHYVDQLGLRQDAYNEHTATLDHLDVSVRAAIRKPVQTAFAQMSHGVQRANRLALAAIQPSDARIGGTIDRFRDQNVRLIEDAMRDYAQQVRDIMTAVSSHGKRVEDLADEIFRRGKVSESRAELIARDQTLKLNGQVNMTRQTNAGIEKYIWSTSQDERVRPEHAALEGKIFDWTSPPEPGHPGEDFQCRCVAIPVIPGLDDEES